MHTSLIFKYFYLNKVLLYSIFIPVQRSTSLRRYNNKYLVPVRPHVVHTTSITEIIQAQTYIARTIRPTLRTLYSILSPVLLSFDIGGVRDYPVGVQIDPFGIWFGVILRYQPPKLSWRRRQHDAFRNLVFWFNGIFPTTLTFPGNLCCFRYAVVHLVHAVNLKLPFAPRPGVPRG